MSMVTLWSRGHAHLVEELTCEPITSLAAAGHVVLVVDEEGLRIQRKCSIRSLGKVQGCDGELGIESTIVLLTRVRVELTFSLRASIDTYSPNFARHTRASYILPVASAVSERFRTAIVCRWSTMC